MRSLDNLLIFAKTYSRNLNVDIRVTDCDAPQVRGQQILLPKHYANLPQEKLVIILSALMHEVGHIRYTEQSCGAYEVKEVFECLNLLEDIRIDTIAQREYAGYSDMTRTTINALLQEYGDIMHNETLPTRILKNMYTKAISDIYYDDEAKEAIEREYYIYIQKAINANRTRDLIMVARELKEKLFGSSQNQGQGNNAKTEKLQELLEKTLSKAKDKTDKAIQEYEENNKDLEKNLNKIKSAKANITRNKRNKEQAILDNKDTTKYKEKIEEYQEALKEAEKENKECLSKYTQSQEKLRQKSKEQDNIEKRIFNIKTNGNNSIDMGMGLSGFQGVGDMVENFCITEISKNLDDVLINFFNDQKDNFSNVEEGYRLDTNKLSGLLTYDDNIFTETIKESKATLVTFLVDCSGSMSNGLAYNSKETKSQAVLQALFAVTKSLDRIIRDYDLNIKFNISSFNTEVQELKKFNETFNQDRIQNSFRVNGDTRLFKSINKVSETMRQEDAESRIIIVLTDGGVSMDELRQLANNKPEDIKIGYIGIGFNLRYMSGSIFTNENNIIDSKDTINIISNVLLNKLA